MYWVKKPQNYNTYVFNQSKYKVYIFLMVKFINNKVPTLDEQRLVRHKLQSKGRRIQAEHKKKMHTP